MQIPKDGLKDELAPMPIDQHPWHADGLAQVEDHEMGHDGIEDAPVAWIEKESPAGEIEERDDVLFLQQVGLLDEGRVDHVLFRLPFDGWLGRDGQRFHGGRVGRVGGRALVESQGQKQKNRRREDSCFHGFSPHCCAFKAKNGAGFF